MIRSSRNFLFIMLFVTSAMAAPRSGSSGRGGGDEVALQFQRAFASAHARIRSEFPELRAQIARLDLQDIASGADIIVVDTALSVVKDGKQQYSIAENDPTRGVILINRVRWRAVRDQRVLEAVALHEILSLAGIESTGRYPLSSLYIARFGYSVGTLEPVPAPCFAPKSQRSSCATQAADVSYVKVDLRSSTVAVDCKSGKTDSASLSLSGGKIQFSDENKTYEIFFGVSGGVSSAGMVALSIVAQQPTGIGAQAVRKIRSLTFDVPRAREIGRRSRHDQSILVENVGSEKVQGEYRPPEGGVARFYEKTFPDGTVLQILEHVGSRSGPDGCRMSSTRTSVESAPTDPFTYSALVTESFHRSLASFIRSHHELVELKGRLNACQWRENPSVCTDLRRKYESGDKRRDEEFLALAR